MEGRGVTRLLLLSASGLALLSACGDDDQYQNQPRPPTPIVISGSVNDQRLSVSPRRFGAGPVTLVVTNQTEGPQVVTLETAQEPGGGPGIKQSTGPINPGDTARLQANLTSGQYRVCARPPDDEQNSRPDAPSCATAAGGISDAVVDVGAERPTAQDTLLQP